MGMFTYHMSMDINYHYQCCWKDKNDIVHKHSFIVTYAYHNVMDPYIMFGRTMKAMDDILSVVFCG